MSRGAWGGRYTAVAVATLALAIFGTIGPVHSQDRTLSFKQMHTGETLTVTYMRGGRYDAAGLEKINYMLRDWRRDESTKIDPRLIDIIWEIHRETGSRGPVHILSGYRSPQTNAALRSRSGGVAKNSQHMHGKALDFYLPDVPLAKLRAVALRKQGGGVGYYPTSGSPFVHVDTGSVRHWPRMTRQQLASLFPDGKTVHIPSDGKPLAGYEQARIEIAQRRSGSSTAVASAGGTGRGLLAALFGGNRNRAAATTPSRPTPAAAAPAPTAVTTQPVRPDTGPAADPAPVQVAAAEAPVPAPRPGTLLASLAPGEVPVPLERPLLTASLSPALASDPAQTPAAPAAGGLSRGAMEALIALAPDRAIDDRLPFSATFTDSGHLIDGAPELVAIDVSDEAMQTYVAPHHCDQGPAFAQLSHPDQSDLSQLIQSAEIVVVNWFEPRPAVASSGRFAGAAVRPLAARSYRSAAL